MHGTFFHQSQQFIDLGTKQWQASLINGLYWIVPKSAELFAAVVSFVSDKTLPREFGAALTRIQQRVGDAFAAEQGGRFHPRSGPLVEALLRCGAAGAGQSSWGPAVYGVVGSEAAGRELVRGMEKVVGGDGSVEQVVFDNHGARVERS